MKPMMDGRGRGARGALCQFDAVNGRAVCDNDGVAGLRKRFVEWDNRNPPIDSARSGKTIMPDRRDADVKIPRRAVVCIDVFSQTGENETPDADLGQLAHRSVDTGPTEKSF